MAWIKVEHTTPEKPEVFQIAATLGADPDAVLGKIVRLWIWVDQQACDPHVDAVRVTGNFIDFKTGTPGFAAAMLKAGWLLEMPDGLTFPHLDRHIAQTAKLRGLKAVRTQRYRAKKRWSSSSDDGDGASPATTSPTTAGLPRSRVRERREDPLGGLLGGAGGVDAAPSTPPSTESSPPSDLVQRWLFAKKFGAPASTHEVAAMLENLAAAGVTEEEVRAEIDNPARNRGEFPAQFAQRLLKAKHPAKAPAKETFGELFQKELEKKRGGNPNP